MLIRKVIPGFVIQTYDTEKKLWIDQDFIPSTLSQQIEFEDAETGNAVDAIDAYLSPNMVQPSQAYPDGETA